MLRCVFGSRGESRELRVKMNVPGSSKPNTCLAFVGCLILYKSRQLELEVVPFQEDSGLTLGSVGSVSRAESSEEIRRARNVLSHQQDGWLVPKGL